MAEAAQRAIIKLALLGMGKINYMLGYGRDPNKRYVVARLDLTRAEVVSGKNAPMASFEVSQFTAEDANLGGVTLVNQDKSATCRMSWEEIRPLRDLEIKPDEMCVAMFLKDGIAHAIFKRSDLTQPI